MPMSATDDRTPSPTKQVVVVALILLGLTLLVCGALLSWHHVPGVLGEWIGTMVGMMSTPFFLEASFIFIGLSIVMWINHLRQKREGDELVYLDEKPPLSNKSPEEGKSESRD